MKKVLFTVLALTSCLALTGCFEKKEVIQKSEVPAISTSSEFVENEPEIEINSEEDIQTQNALEAIRNALKDEEWVKNNVMMQKTCFGEDVVADDQELTFAMLGKDRVIVQAFAYEDTFGIANTVVAYKDGKVVTMGLPTINEPAHPGHVGYGIVPDEDILVESYMHMGNYINNYYKILDNDFEKIASFESSEYGEDGVLLEDESGNLMVDYKYTINGEEEKGRTTSEAFEQRVMKYMDVEKIKSIENQLTPENVDLYIK